jgi:hypothetical protein
MSYVPTPKTSRGKSQKERRNLQFIHKHLIMPIFGFLFDSQLGLIFV